MKSIEFAPTLGKQVLVNGLMFVVTALEGPNRVVLMRVDSGQTVTFERNTLARMAIAGTFQSLDGARQADKPPLPNLSFDSLSDSGKKRVSRRVAYVKGVINEFPVGPNSTRLSNAVAAAARRLNDSEVPSPHSVYRWLTRYVQSGYDVNALAKDAMTKRSRTPRLPEKVKKRLEECLLEELGADVGASIWGVTDKILEQIAVELEYDGFVTTRGSVTLLASAAKAASAEARP